MKGRQPFAVEKLTLNGSGPFGFIWSAAKDLGKNLKILYIDSPDMITPH